MFVLWLHRFLLQPLPASFQTLRMPLLFQSHKLLLRLLQAL